MYGIIDVKKIIPFLFAVSLLVAGRAMAETTVYDSFTNQLNGQTVNGTGNGQNAGGGDSDADRIAAGMVADPNAVVDSTQTNSSLGREQKASDGSSQSGTGKGVAIGTGAALMARAIPMLASIDPVVRATGAELMAKAGLEFAQAAADGGTEKANKAQENLLRAEADQNIDQAMKAAGEQGKKEVENQVANTVAGNAELQKVLGQNGVNGDDFAKQFASGGLLTPESILAATGAGNGVDAAAMAEGLANASKEPLGNQATLTAIQEDSDREGNGSKRSSENDGGGGSGPQMDDRKFAQSGDFGRGAGEAAPGGLAGLLDSVSRGGASALDGLKHATDGELASMLAGLVGMGGSAAGAPGDVGKKLFDKDALAKKGILKATGKPGIFMLARRNYRSFQKWRRKATTTVAANGL